mgnify:FL=1
MGLEGLEKRAIGALSGGQLQRALLGRAIISDPALVVLDEPSTYIDKRFEARLYELLAEINHDCAIILVSHDIGTVLQQVKSIACVNETLDYHPDTGVSEEWLERNFNCPIELLGHELCRIAYWRNISTEMDVDVVTLETFLYKKSMYIF